MPENLRIIGGTVVDYGLSYPIEVSDLLEFNVQWALTWSDQKYMQSYFGVTEAQSQVSGFAKYTPSSGNKQSSIDLQAKYKLSKRYLVGMEYFDLSFQNEATKSPLVNSSHNQIYSIFIGYRP